MPFPTSVDAIVDAPPITAATVIHASQVQGPQRITVGPAWFNAKSDQYGAVGERLLWNRRYGGWHGLSAGRQLQADWNYHDPHDVDERLSGHGKRKGRN